MIPLNKVIADKIGKLSTDMMKAKDERTSSMSEILSGFRQVKYLGWEPFFAQRVSLLMLEQNPTCYSTFSGQ